MLVCFFVFCFFFSSRRRHTRSLCDWSSDVCSSDLVLGFVLGVVAATLTTLVQWLVAWTGSIVTYEDWPLLGVLFGAGAMAGDSAKSFFKRRLGVEPGRPWIPFDQLDFVLGALVLVVARVALAWADVVTILLLSFCGHILVNHLGYWLGVRDTRW